MKKAPQTRPLDEVLPPGPDKVDLAIAGVGAKAPPDPKTQEMVNALTLSDGQKITLIVPFEFTSDMFETAVAGLMQLRYAAQQRELAKQPQIAVPDHSIVGPDGRKLS